MGGWEDGGWAGVAPTTSGRGCAWIEAHAADAAARGWGARTRVAVARPGTARLAPTSPPPAHVFARWQRPGPGPDVRFGVARRRAYAWPCTPPRPPAGTVRVAERPLQNLSRSSSPE